MPSHVQQTVTRCFAVLRQLRSIRRSVPTSVSYTLVVVLGLVLSKLVYGNATLVGIPANLLSRLQLGQSLIFIDRLTSQTLLPVSTGYVLSSALSSNWR